MAAEDGPFTLAFVGWAAPAMAAAASAYEDAVLPLLADHGARVEYRGLRSLGQSEDLPVEVHLLWFPSRAAFDAYLADPRRAALLEEHGDVFTRKLVVELDESPRSHGGGRAT
ncbi:MAG TPA: hypothetical protein VJ804_15180 [Acidimicrobiales bacterium]|nr:hypothetical protein [Acidimicrobiales bacterium]